MAAEKKQPEQTSQVGQDVVKTKQKEPEIQSKHKVTILTHKFIYVYIYI